MNSTLRHFVADMVLPNRQAWVRVRRGIAKGIWLRVNLSSERNWWSGNHEPPVQRQFSKWIHEGSVLYDVGAHIGFFSLAAARLGARVIAFEADPENVDRLNSHLMRNEMTARVTIVAAAVWSASNPKLPFRRGLPRSQGGVTTSTNKPVLASGPVIEVAAVTIDSFVAAGGPVPDVIKVDVEGGEIEVLKGAAATVQSKRPNLILEIHHREALLTVQEFLQQNSYVADWLVPPEGFPRQCFATRIIE